MIIKFWDSRFRKGKIIKDYPRIGENIAQVYQKFELRVAKPSRLHNIQECPKLLAFFRPFQKNSSFSYPKLIAGFMSSLHKCQYARRVLL